MTLYYPDPELLSNVPVKSRDVGAGIHVTAHDIEALPSEVMTLLNYLATIAANQGPPSAIYGGTKDVTTAGTRVQLSSSSQALTEGVWVRAKDANTGLIYVGNSTVSSTAGGTRLAKGESLFVRINNLNAVWLDSAVSAEGVTYLGW